MALVHEKAFESRVDLVEVAHVVVTKPG
jgi:hypothetical protein